LNIDAGGYTVAIIRGRSKMAERTPAELAAISATLDVIYRHASTIAAMPKGQREAHFKTVRESLEEAVEPLDLPSEHTTEWIDLMMKTMRAMVLEIEIGPRTPSTLCRLRPRSASSRPRTGSCDTR
jgi:hypothetical protein